MKLKCSVCPDTEFLELIKTNGGSVYARIVSQDEDTEERIDAEVNINPEDIYKFLSDNYDLNKLKEKAETT